MIKYLCIVAFFLFGLTSCATPPLLSSTFDYSSKHSRDTAAFDDSHFWQATPTAIWNKLAPTALAELQTTLAQTHDENNRAWLTLAIISQQYSNNTQALIPQLLHWRKEHPTHPANLLFPSNTMLNHLLSVPLPQHIALLLPLQGKLSVQSQVIREGFLSAYYESPFRNQQTVSFYDTSKNQDITALYQQALTQGADIIIGPLTKNKVQALLKQNSFALSTIALNYTDLWFGSLPANFYEFGLSPIDEAQQIASKAAQAGYSHALLIAPQNEWGQRISKPLLAQWQLLGGKITDTFYYSPQSNLAEGIASLLHINQKEDRAKMQKNNNKKVLEQQRRQDVDVIFLLAQPQAAREIVPLLKYYYADNLPIYSSSTIYSGVPDPQKDADLNGVYFCNLPWLLKMATVSPTQNDLRFNPFYAVGRDAYLLSHELARLTQLPHFPLYAATGALTLSSKQQIYRQLPWIQVHAGHL
jgi:outer membrane PBP1 activator LpoA protein